MSELLFDDVTVHFGHGKHTITAVDHVTLAVPAGKVLGLVGESGSGKSTLARVAVGLTPADGGRVLLDGLKPRWRRHRGIPPRVQMVFQDPYSSLDPRMTVGDSIYEAMPARAGLSRATRRAEVARLLELVHLDAERSTMLPTRLSGGQRQRVALARALAARPSVIIADEITSALDVSVQGVVLNLLCEIQRELEFGMLFISHNLAAVRYISDTIAVMYRGRIVEHGSRAEMLANCQHPYTRELIAAAPRPLAHEQPLGPDAAEWPGMSPELLDVDQSKGAGCKFAARCPVGPNVISGRTVCRSEEPRLRVVVEAHQVACHFASILGAPEHDVSG